MKIGIMTFWWSENNYGQILQCYALQKYLQDAGYEAYLIRYDPRNDYVKPSLRHKILRAFNPVKLCRFFKHRLTYSTIEKFDRIRDFDGFRDKYIKQSERIYYSYQELVDDPPEADVYITGSDQVWNPDWILFENTDRQVKAYFLDFGGVNTTRIAYAASFGKEKLSSAFVREITPLLKKFDYISVREKSGVNLCRQCGVDMAEWVPDPAMLLSTADYRALYRHEPAAKVEKPYCLLYMVGDTCNFPVKTIYAWAKKKALDIVYITANGRSGGRRKFYAAVPQWLYLIDHAEYVITNSFHGSLFSVLFQKRFGVISLTGKYLELNGRCDSLFELLKIKKRFIKNPGDMDVLDEDIDWEPVSNILQRNRVSCKLADIL
jgi:hypothetical protein